ncbi:SEL1-like repeat protein [Campylobacter showae]|uniref:SEL1-like repeat protein n=1 Tax=Campylobacter showae TaxID=204 RepID=UPI001F13C806|nr:SEL1-like repeat protein [Campylobacter showae]
MACDDGELSSCHSLGLLYTNGQGVKQDYQKAIQLYQKACDERVCGLLSFRSLI